MDSEKILYVLRLPGRLVVLQVAVLLNFHADAIYHFVKIGLLEPIGPSDGVQLYFDAQYINGLRYNAKWLRKATAAWRSHTGDKNLKQREKAARTKVTRHE